jgi:hypothetical protein
MLEGRKKKLNKKLRDIGKPEMKGSNQSIRSAVIDYPRVQLHF